MISRQRYPFVVAIGLGLTYSLTARLLFDNYNFAQSGLLSLSFLVAMPLALGALTAHFIPAKAGASTWWRLLWAPFLVVLSFLVASLAFHLEGLICILIMCPLFLLLAAIGAYGYTRIADPIDTKRNKTLVVAAFSAVPFIAPTLENRFDNPDDFRRVENSVLIAAPAAVVWQHIIRVAPIGAADLGHSLIDDMGFPRPIEATLTREGVGGVRHATFERGVEFIETVDDWQPLKRLSFSIVPNTATIPPTTFDEHVIVGGRFFDVLRGTYELRPAGPGRTLLVLHSQQRLSTHLNWYAGLWTGWVMSEIQGRILTVLKHRCETAG